ncbi:MAG: pantoate--beta-alanine ligase [Steroidobacteraceae bacterium]
MKLCDTLAGWQAFRAPLGGRVGFVPTMGCLHAGHASLVARSLQECDHTILSIFVNPAQFNDPKDLERYPRTLDADLALARELGVDAVLLPVPAMLYPDGYAYRVQEMEFSTSLCGASRPGHFTGVLTVVMKLLNLVQPTRAYFGEKDHQQLELIRGMAAAFFMNVEIVGCATVRDADGLALSSRNRLLDAKARQTALGLVGALREARSDEEAIQRLTHSGLAVDYVETRGGRRYAAVRVETPSGIVRLIDNLELS